MTDFERWWYDEGSANRPVDEDIEEFAKRMCQVAWSNGAFVERNRTWTQEHWTEYEHSIAAAEREACAKTVESFYGSRDEYAAAIRARGHHD